MSFDYSQNTISVEKEGTRDDQNIIQTNKSYHF